jgi:two-component system, OmpR family, response regulator
MAKILVIDSSPDIRDMMTMVLQIYGHEVAALSEDVAVGSFISLFDPQLLLLDVRHGKRSGREICRDIKATKRNLPVILMSTSEILLAGYETCYADDVITKPFEIVELKAKIEKALLNNSTTKNLSLPSSFFSTLFKQSVFTHS